MSKKQEVCGAMVGDGQYNMLVHLPKWGVVRDTPSHTADISIQGFEGTPRGVPVEEILYQLGEVRNREPNVEGILYTKQAVIFLFYNDVCYYCRDDLMKHILRQGTFKEVPLEGQVIQIIINTMRAK